MNFIEAMKLIHKDCVGPRKVKGVKQKSVKRPNHEFFVFYDSTKFLGTVEFGFRFANDPSVHANPWTPTMEDILAEDWEIFKSK